MLRRLIPSRDTERGASAILIALSMVLLLSVMAVALDLSAGFNERNQDQNAGDNGVMSGALEKAVGDPVDQMIVTQALAIAQANLTAEFPGGATDPSWISMWRNCTDAGNPGWVPLAEPAAWGGGGTLDCLSQTTSLLRMRIPDQLLNTNFGGFVGADTLTTNAISIARTAFTGIAPPVVPFGVNAGAQAGEYCLASGPSGTSYPPCTGPQTGAFGDIDSPIFGDFGDHDPVCNGNLPGGVTFFERNLVWGLDHRLKEWPHASGVMIGSAWPGLGGLPDINRDGCKLDPDRNATPLDGIPLNTVNVGTGVSNPGLTRSLVSNNTYEGKPSRLQQGTNPKRTVRSGLTAWGLDNRGPWYYLTETSANVGCRKSSYTPAMTTEAKVTMFESCLADTTAGEIFSHTITSSPRFVWAPEYVYDSPPGNKYNPIRGFRPMFLAGVWFNCSGVGCSAEFFPDEDVTTNVCIPGGPGGCKMATVDQFSSWLLPDASLPMSVFDDFEATFANLEPELFQ